MNPKVSHLSPFNRCTTHPIQTTSAAEKRGQKGSYIFMQHLFFTGTRTVKSCSVFSTIGSYSSLHHNKCLKLLLFSVFAGYLYILNLYIFIYLYILNILWNIYFDSFLCKLYFFAKKQQNGYQYLWIIICMQNIYTFFIFQQLCLSPTECPLVVVFGNDNGFANLRLIFMTVGANQNLIYLIYFSICWHVDCVV